MRPQYPPPGAPACGGPAPAAAAPHVLVSASPQPGAPAVQTASRAPTPRHTAHEPAAPGGLLTRLRPLSPPARRAQGPYSIQFTGAAGDGSALFCVDMAFTILPPHATAVALQPARKDLQPPRATPLMQAQARPRLAAAPPARAA